MDSDILRHIGGKENKSLIRLIESDSNLDDENEPCIIKHSSFHDFNKLVSVLKNCKDKFSVFSTNIGSIRAKMNEFKIIIERLKNHNCYFSAICIQESWLTDNEDISNYELQDYSLISQGKHCSTKGGLLIYLHDTFQHMPKSQLKYDTWEGQFIRIKKCDCLSKPIILGNIYRPPNESIEHYTKFIAEFSSYLSTLESNNIDVIIAGDYNINLLKINERTIVSDYFDMLTSHSFFPKITLPTRLTNNNGTLIDNFLCKLTETTLDTTSGVILEKLSDHQPYFTVLNNISLKDPPPKFVRVITKDKASIDNFNQAIMNSDKLNHLDTNPKQNPNINYNILHQTVQEAKNVHLPEKMVKFDKHKHKKSKWITHSLIKSITFRDNLYIKMKKTDPDSDLYHTLKSNLKTFNNILRKTIKAAQKSYYETLFNKYKGNIKGTWKTINCILNKTKRKKHFPKLFINGNSILTDKPTIVNRFNSFFANIGPNLSSKINMPVNKNFHSYLNKKHSFNFNFKDINTDVINQIIDSLAPKSSSGYDGISTKLLKLTKNSILKPITIIVNQMLNTGIFPDNLKIAKVNPIFKKDDERQFTNYRPISLLSSISKIFEKVIFKQLYTFFQEKQLFYSSQYGFREKHSTEFAALELVDRVTVEMDQSNTPISLFLDLSKAFDTLDHEILLSKLDYYGIKGIAHQLMKSYITERTQFVEIDDTKSSCLTLTTGIPQGSILGPLLFLIYINDISQASKMFNFVIYADDTNLTTTLELVAKQYPNVDISTAINSELINISDWLKTNRLSLNVQKSKYMIFHQPQKKIRDLLILINDTEIERVSDFDFLGLSINESLNWKSHTDKIANKISRSIGILNRMKNILPLQPKIIIYNSLILSYLNFGILSWGYKCERIIKLQKKSVRILSCSKYNAHTEPLFKQLKLLKIQDILKLQELKTYYKFKHSNLPNYQQNMPFHNNVETHNYNTRQRNDIHNPLAKHEYAKRCLRFNLPHIVNSTPAIILDKVNTHSLSGFSWYIKQYMIQSYQDSCTIQNCYICSNN